MATYFYGHPIPRTDRQCTRRGRDAELSGGRPTLVCTHHTRPVASRTHAVPVVWTSMATYFYGHPIPRTDRQCKRPGRDAELLGGRPTFVCTHHTRLSRRGRTPYPWFGLLRPHTSMATAVRARSWVAIEVCGQRGPNNGYGVRSRRDRARVVGANQCRASPQQFRISTGPRSLAVRARNWVALEVCGHKIPDHEFGVRSRRDKRV